MIHKLLVLACMAALLAACNGVQMQNDNDAPVGAYPGPGEEPNQPPNDNDAPVSSYPGPGDEPSLPSAGGLLNNSYLPQPDDSNFTRGEVFIDSTNLLVMESFPVQIALDLKGNLPTPCNQLRVVAHPPDEQNRILVEVYSVIDPDQMCAQVLKPFEANLNLGSFPPGHYTVWVNEEMVGEFDS